MIDYDLAACLENNPQEGIAKENIAAVLAVWEGERDGDAWRWVLVLTDGRFAFVYGTCDYTGWDCSSNAYSHIADTVEEAARSSLFIGYYGWRNRQAYAELLRQVREGKDETWRGRKDREFGVVSGEG